MRESCSSPSASCTFVDRTATTQSFPIVPKKLRLHLSTGSRNRRLVFVGVAIRFSVAFDKQLVAQAADLQQLLVGLGNRDGRTRGRGSVPGSATIAIFRNACRRMQINILDRGLFANCRTMPGTDFPRLGEFDVGARDGLAEPENTVQKYDKLALSIGVGFREDILQLCARRFVRNTNALCSLHKRSATYQGQGDPRLAIAEPER